ncbi:hypothetical protein FS749_015421 [Ceratobasidium sp. UAMH 11750]|nr:hypothetical protein FS749_015421 [Ceratobasidium sp. UAMH 11750]
MAAFIQIDKFEYSGAYSYEYMEWSVANCRRVRVVCGPEVVAGLGMQTLHGQDSLLEGTHKMRNGRTIRGANLFVPRNLSNPERLCLIHRLLAAHRQQAATAIPTPFHSLLDYLFRRGKLDQCYSLNLDGLEGKISPEMLREESGPAVMQVFRNNREVICDTCKVVYPAERFEDNFANGVEVFCPECSKETEQFATRRSQRTGKSRLRPRTYPFELVSHNQDKQVRTGEPPEVLLLVGICWKVKRVANLVRSLIDSFHTVGERVICVGLKKPAKSLWGQHIDACLQLDLQEWAMRQLEAFVSHESHPLNGLEMLESFFVPPPKSFSLNSGIGQQLWSGSPNACSLCLKDHEEVVRPCHVCYALYCMQGPAATEISNCVQLGKLDPAISLEDIDVDFSDQDIHMSGLLRRYELSGK